jgi:pSer/pThr/pTyr-binding forkhead associated (FHA) protein
MHSAPSATAQVTPAKPHAVAARPKDANKGDAEFATSILNVDEINSQLALMAAAVQTAAQPQQRRTGAPHAILVITNTFHRFELTTDEILIGRHQPGQGIKPDVDLTSVDSSRSVSRPHAKICRSGSNYLFIEQDGVSNGSYVNGKRIQAGVSTPLAFGDQLLIGKVHMSFEKAPG